LCLFFYIFPLHTVQAASNNTSNFQGKIVIKNGGYNVTATSPACVRASLTDTCAFRIGYYSAASGGTMLWREEFRNIEIGEYEGVFNLPLGTGTNGTGSETTFTNVFINNTDVYMQIEFDATGNQTFSSVETFVASGGGRLQMKAVPYAIRASIADQISTANEQFIKNQTTQQLSSNFNISGNGTIGGNLNVYGNTLFVNAATGNVGIGAASPNQKLTVDGSFGILEGGTTPEFHTIFAGGDQIGDITYTLPASSLDGFLSNIGGVLSWVPITGNKVGITSFNGLTNSSQTVEIGTTGTAPTWNSAPGGVHTLNIPNASVSGVTAGLVSNSQFSNWMLRNGDTGSGIYSFGGGAFSINNDSNYATNINTGNSTGTVTIGGGSGAVTVNANTFTINSGATDDILTINGGTYSTTLTFNQATVSNKNIIFPNASGTVAFTSELHTALSLGTANGLSLLDQTLSLDLASSSLTGALSSTDWNAFNSKQDGLTFGNISSTTSGITINNGTNATVGPNTTIDISTASGSSTGLLTSSDWTSFSGKLTSVNWATVGNGTNVYMDYRPNNSACGDGYLLTYDATNYRWVCGSSAFVSVAGSAGDIQFNDGAGNFGASSLVHWDAANSILGVGFGGIYAPSTNNNYSLSVNRRLEIQNPDSSTSSPAELVFTKTASAGNFRIRSEGNDFFWQGGGGNVLQMGSYWATVIMGNRQSSTLPAFVAGSNGTGMIVMAARDTDKPLAVRGFSGTQSGNLQEWQTSTGTMLAAVDPGGAFVTASSGNALVFTGTNPNIVIPEDTTLSVNDANGHNLILARNINTNFGMTVESGAFITRNSYWEEGFMNFRPTFTADSAAAGTGSTANLGAGWGDSQGLGVDENTACSFSTPATVNGVGRLQTAGTNAACLAYSGTNTAGTANTITAAVNLPVFMGKAMPSAATSATNRLWIGLSTIGTASTADPANGIFFTNDSAGNWVGMTRSSSATTTVPCGVAVSITSFGLVKAEVVSTTSVNFYVDPNTSDGISWTYCGNSSTNIPSVSLSAMMMFYSTSNNRYLDVDFLRVWSDDAASPIEVEQTTELVEAIDPNPQMRIALNAMGDLVVASTEDEASLMSFNNDRSIDIDANVNFSGGLSADCVGLGGDGGALCNSSIAERYTTRDRLTPGDIVALDSGSFSDVSRATTATVNSMVGVVVKRPGITLGDSEVNINITDNDPYRPAVAFAGIVELKVSDINGPIKKSDYLTAGSMHGIAVKADKPGFAVAQALEDLNGSSSGKIKAIVRPGFVDPADVFNTVAGKLAEVEAMVAGLNNIDQKGTTPLELQEMFEKLAFRVGIAFDSESGANELSQLLLLTASDNTDGALRLVILKDLEVNGAVVINGDITFNGNINVGSNTAGRLTVKTGETKVEIKFDRPYKHAPVVNISPRGLVGAGYYISDETTKGFVINLEKSLPQDVEFNWSALGLLPPDKQISEP
jgi:hypothetical protein